MKKLIKCLLQRFAGACAGKMYEDIIHDINHCRTEITAARSSLQQMSEKEAQLLLYHTYKRLVAEGAPLPSLTEVGFRRYSQFEEDGILLYLFAVAGMTNRKCVEICAGNGIQCNTANLILNHGWWGYLFDGDEDNVATGTEFFQESLDTWAYPPKFVNAWITAENVNDLIGASGVEGDIDLLSLDVDGMDYWIWDAIECITPRIVVCETHNIIGPDDAITVPYDPDFKITVPDYHSASLAAMTKLAGRKGYRLVGTHRYGFNAFFVRNDIADNLLPSVTPAECLADPYSQDARTNRWPKVSNMKWVQV